MTTNGSSTNNGTTSTTTTTTKECYCCLSISCGECSHNGGWWAGAEPAVFALVLLPTMLAVAGATFFAHALLPTMLAGAGPTFFALALLPTMLAVAGPTFFALALLPTMHAEVFAAVCFALPRPYAALAHGASIHLDILEMKRMKHMHWCICLTSLTGLGRCHYYIPLVISGRK
jgi:hypothetical protein